MAFFCFKVVIHYSIVNLVLVFTMDNLLVNVARRTGVGRATLTTYYNKRGVVVDNKLAELYKQERDNANEMHAAIGVLEKQWSWKACKRVWVDVSPLTIARRENAELTATIFRLVAEKARFRRLIQSLSS